MSMRKQFIKTVEEILIKNTKVVLLLGDIGVFGFSNAFKNHPDRVFNIGILESSTIGLASGMAKSDLIPIVHTIAPFLVERAYEQIKIDFGYQKLGGNFVSVGASYDYASLGCTHHCPADVAVLQNIPGVQIVLPGTALEFDMLFKETYANKKPTYFRLSERENKFSHNIEFGKAVTLKKGKLATVIAIGPTLDFVMNTIENMDVSLLYFTTVAPFDSHSLRDAVNENLSNKIMLIEPFYTGTLINEVMKSLYPRAITIDSIGVPREFLTEYGTVIDHDKKIGFTSNNLKQKLEALIAE